MRKRIHPAWLILMFPILSLTITACVKPYPGSDASASEPVAIPQATQQPIIAPQQPVITPDLGAPTAVPVEVMQPTSVPLEPASEQVAEQTHTVAAGETLFKIALEYGVTVDDIAAANNITDVNSLEVGQLLQIPAPGSEPSTVIENTSETDAEGTQSDSGAAESSAEPAVEAGSIHVVQPGENLFRISLNAGCTVEQVARHNGIVTPNRISVGQEIEIPDCN